MIHLPSTEISSTSQQIWSCALRHQTFQHPLGSMIKERSAHRLWAERDRD